MLYYTRYIHKYVDKPVKHSTTVSRILQTAGECVTAQCLYSN